MLLKFQTDICLLGGFPQVDTKFTCFTSTKVQTLTPMRLPGDARRSGALPPMHGRRENTHVQLRTWHVCVLLGGVRGNARRHSDGRVGARVQQARRVGSPLLY
jgi:hypothetical protein